MKEPPALDELALKRIKKLKLVLFMTGGYLIAEIIGGLVTNSLALIADAGHMLTDVGGIALALFAISYARRPRTPQRTYGFYRVEILAALTNSVILVLLSIYIFYEAYKRFAEPPEVQSLTMIVVASIGLVVNFVSYRLLGGHDHTSESKQAHKDKPENLNIEGARIEVFSDTLGSAGVVAAGVIILATGFSLVDPIVSVGLGLFILPRTWSLLKKSIHILMEGVPTNISYDEVRKAILEVRGVTGLFELHIWSITSGMDALSAHVVVIDQSKSQSILQEITSILEKRFDITHATIQIETYHRESDNY